MSYRKRSIKFKIQKAKPKNPIYKKGWFWILILISIISIFFLYMITFYEGFQIKNINVSGNTKINSEDIKNIVKEYTGVNFFNFLKSDSIFLTNNHKVAKKITSKYPAIENVLIKKDLPETISIEINERKQLGFFCNGNQNYMIDNNGVIFEQVQSLPNGALIIKQNNNESLYLGKEAVQKSFIEVISKVKRILEEDFKINLEEAMIADSSNLDIKTSDGWWIYFDLGKNSNIDSQILKLNLLLEKESSEDNIKNLRYINLIPEDRAVVCDNNICGN